MGIDIGIDIGNGCSGIGGGRTRIEGASVGEKQEQEQGQASRHECLQGQVNWDEMRWVGWGGWGGRDEMGWTVSYYLVVDSR